MQGDNSCIENIRDSSEEIKETVVFKNLSTAKNIVWKNIKKIWDSGVGWWPIIPQIYELMNQWMNDQLSLYYIYLQHKETPSFFT